MKRNHSIYLIIILFLVNITYASIFDEQYQRRMNMPIDSINCDVRFIDFNGDSMPDLLINQNDGNLDDWIVFNNYSFFNHRDAINIPPNFTSSLPVHYALLPPVSKRDTKDTLLLVTPNGDLEVIRYVNDDEISVWERYIRFHYSLDSGESDTVVTNWSIHDALIVDHENDLPNPYLSDLLVIASKNSGTYLYQYLYPFSRSFSNQNEVLHSTQVYPLPGVPSTFWSCFINSDRRSDLFFEHEGQWHIWLADEAGNGYSPGVPGRSFSFLVPEGVKRAVDVIGRLPDLGILVSVESERDAEIAYVLFSEPMADPIPVTIPSKHLQGAITRLFSYENKNTGESYPLSMVYNPLDPQNLQPNPISIYRIDPANPLSPQLVQTFISEYTIGDKLYYFDRPELVDDFDQDGISDLILMAFPAQEETIARGRLVGFAGIPSSTKIPEWSLHEPR